VTSSQQRKGDQFERDIAAYMRAHDVPIIRQHDGGTLDRGDFIMGPFVVEAKAYADLARGLREGTSDAAASAYRTDLIPATIVKRRGYAITASFFAMQLGHVPQLWRLLR